MPESNITEAKPDCYACVHRRTIPGNAHTRCNNVFTQVTGSQHGIDNGWFRWPGNFDPTWLLTCDGFSADPQDNRPTEELNPRIALLWEALGFLR